MELTFTIGAYEYKAQAMPCRIQFHVNRRLGPLIANSLESIFKAVGGADEAVAIFIAYNERDEQPKMDKILAALPPLAEALANLSDSEADYIIDHCLRLVARQTPGASGWAKIVTNTGQMMFDDINMPIMIQIVVNVLKANLSDFTIALRSLTAAQKA